MPGAPADSNVPAASPAPPATPAAGGKTAAAPPVRKKSVLTKLGRFGAAIRDTHRNASVANSDGSTQCQVACIDLVEDSVRHRWIAVGLLFSLFAPFVCYVVVGDVSSPWDRTVGLVDAESSSTDFAASLTSMASTACIAEQLCLNATTQAVCDHPCLALFADDAFFAPVVVNGSVVVAGAAVNASALSPPPPPMAVGASRQAHAFGAFFFYLVFTFVALFGNSSFHKTSDLCTYVALFFVALLFILIIVAVPAESPLFLAWWCANLVALVGYALVVGGLVCTRKGRTPPALVGRMMARDHRVTRHQAYLEYCQALRRRPEPPFRAAFRDGVLASATPTYKEQTELWRAEAAYDRERYGWLRQAKVLLGREPADDAVFTPVRIQLAAALSLFATLLLCNGWIRFGISLHLRVAAVDGAYFAPLITAVGAISSNVEAATGVAMPVRDAEAFLREYSGHFRSLGDAVEAAATTGALLAFLLSCGAVAILVLDFRSSVLRARQGRLPFPMGRAPAHPRGAWSAARSRAPSSPSSSSRRRSASSSSSWRGRCRSRSSGTSLPTTGASSSSSSSCRSSAAPPGPASAASSAAGSSSRTASGGWRATLRCSSSTC